VEFANGGALQGQDFRLDIDGDGIDDDALAAYVIRDLRLLMVSRVRVLEKHIIIEPHKRSASAAESSSSRQGSARVIDLSHVMEGDRGTELHIGPDLSTGTLDRFVEIPGVVVRVAGANERALDWTLFAPLAVQGAAVLVHTSWDRHWGTERYAEPHPFLTEKAALHLRDHGARLVGIDSLDIDDPSGESRPARSVLLHAGIPIVQHLTRLELLPTDGFTFSAAPPRGAGRVPLRVRAYATLARS
jgi:arylformamidase